MRIFNFKQISFFVSLFSSLVVLDTANANDVYQMQDKDPIHGSLTDFFNSLNETMVTSSDNFQQTENIISEIKLIQKSLEAENVSAVKSGGLHKKLLHVIIQSVQLQEDVKELHQVNKSRRSGVYNISMVKTMQRKVFQSTEKILGVIRTLKDQLGVNQRIVKARYKGGKSLEQVYDNTWVALNLADTLSNPQTGNIKELELELEAELTCYSASCAKVKLLPYVNNLTAKVSM